MSKFQEAIALFPLKFEPAGGGCGAYEYVPRDGVTLLITDENDCTAPESLDDPVTVGEYHAATEWDMVKSENYPTLREALVALYRTISQDALPECLS